MATIFNGVLKANLVFATQFNQIISQELFQTGIGDLSGIYASRMVDGTLYGDTKLYTATDALKSYPLNQNGTEYNLLTVKRPPEPKTWGITIDTYRQIPVTVDDYFTKQMWQGESVFSAFTEIVLSWLTKTKEVYEHTTYTTGILTAAQAGAKLLGNIPLVAPTGIAGYDLLKWRGQELYRVLEDLVTELKEPSRAYNDAEFLRTYQESDFDIVIPLGVLSSVRKQDIPFLYNPDSKYSIKEIHWKYFGAENATSGTTAANNTTIRALVEKDYGSGQNLVHLFPGDLLPNSTAYAAKETYTAKYTTRPSINDAIEILLIGKRDFPIMSAFSVGTSFFNANTLHNQHYLSFGHNDVRQAHIGANALLKVTTTVA